MKRIINVSAILAALLFATTLQSDMLHDSVAQEAQKALSQGKVKGEAAAKAKDEQMRDKLLFTTKTKRSGFEKEALEDKAKRIHLSVAKELKAQRKNFKEAPKEVFDGLNKTMEAIEAIVHKDNKTAKNALLKATKSFDEALKANPNLKFVPIAHAIDINAFEGDVKLIKNIIKTAQELLADYDVQAARKMLMPLVDEMVVSTEFIPMDVYPIATKDATKALDSGKTKEALAILMTGLNSMVVESVVIPIPLLIAQDMVIAASHVEKSNKKKALALLSGAQNELKKATLLGYAKKHTHEYKAIKKEIKKIKKEIKGKNAVEKLYDHIKESFSKLLKHTKEDVTKNKGHR